jgi:hypothetical protein
LLLLLNVSVVASERFVVASEVGLGFSPGIQGKQKSGLQTLLKKSLSLFLGGSAGLQPCEKPSKHKGL